METPFARLELLLGPEALARLARASVLIAGVGAVGATAAESLARSGIGRLVLADFDEIRPSNLNRHPFAFHSTLGQSKVEVAARYLRDIHPQAEVIPVALFLDGQTAPTLLAEHPCEALIDAIDSLNPKTELLLAARQRRVPFILTCLGAARRTDPRLFTVADLMDSHTCPLGRLLRKRLRKRGEADGIRCVFSAENPAAPFSTPPPPDTFFRGRPRLPLGSLHAATAAAGLLAARETLRFLLEPPCA